VKLPTGGLAGARVPCRGLACLAKIDQRADSYSLGCIVFELTTLAKLIQQGPGFLEAGVLLQRPFHEDDGARAILRPVGDARLPQVRQADDLGVLDGAGGHNPRASTASAA
jgi:hypothetical protein